MLNMGASVVIQRFRESISILKKLVNSTHHSDGRTLGGLDSAPP